MAEDSSDEEMAELQKRLDLIKRETELLKVQLAATRAQAEARLKRDEPRTGPTDDPADGGGEGGG